MKLKLKKEVQIGIFGLAMIALLVWGINFLKGTDLISSSHTYYATYDQVSGLQKSALVVIKGFKVGTISDMSYDIDGSGKIVVELSIKSKYRIPTDSRARIFSDGLMGGKAIELVLGTSPEYLHSGDSLISETDKDLLDVAGSEIEMLKQKLGEVVNNVNTTLAAVNRLLGDENQANIERTLENIANLTGNTNRLVVTETATIHQLIANLNTLARSLSDNSGRIDNILTNAESFTDSLKSAEIPTLVANLNSAVASLNATLGKIADGEGTAGKLV
ncbi:MAG: MlaD family protein, partial [Rikenellaceae bacterium]|nr:MlaD family protein [Rikenellaceae bacterium]